MAQIIILDHFRKPRETPEEPSPREVLFEKERNFFRNGKFLPFAETYIQSGFASKFEPWIELRVNFRDHEMHWAASHFSYILKDRGFLIIPPYRTIPNNHDHNGISATQRIDLVAARQLFLARATSEYGVYQPSQEGFRTLFVPDWDDRGIGFNLMVEGYDGRRADSFGITPRRERHIIDDENDFTEVTDMFADIQRAKFRLI